MEIAKLHRVQPTYKKVIPMDKFCKIFYPRRYMEERSQYHPVVQNTSLDYEKLVERDLYGKKGNRINYIQKQKATRRAESVVPPLIEPELKFPTLLVKSQVKVKEERKLVSLPPYAASSESKNKRQVLNKLKEESIPLESYENNRNSIVKEFTTLESKSEETVVAANSTEKRAEQIGCQWDSRDLPVGTQGEYFYQERYASDIEGDKRKESELKDMENILKHMLERHNPVATKGKLEIGKYKKGTRESISFTALEKGKKSIEDQKKWDAYLRSQIQFQKESYMEKVEKKVKEVDLTRPLKSRHHKRMRRKMNKSVAYTPIKPKEESANVSAFRDTNESQEDDTLLKKLQDSIRNESIQRCSNSTEYSTQPQRYKHKPIYGNIKAAIRSHERGSKPDVYKLLEKPKEQDLSMVQVINQPIEENPFITNLDPSVGDEEEAEVKIPFKIKRHHNFQKLRELIHSIDNGGEELKNRMLNIHSYAKRLRYTQTPI